jgi:hypothetical protein
MVLKHLIILNPRLMTLIIVHRKLSFCIEKSHTGKHELKKKDVVNTAISQTKNSKKFYFCFFNALGSVFFYFTQLI